MKDSHNKLKTQRIYTQVLEEKPEIGEDELTSQRQFDDKDTFVVAKATSEDVGDHIEKTIEQVIRPPRKKRFLLRGLLGAFTALLAWQSAPQRHTRPDPAPGSARRNATDRLVRRQCAG